MEPQRQPFPKDWRAHILRIIEPVVDGDQVTDKDYVDAAIASAMTGLHWQEAVLDRFDPTGGLPADVAGNRYISTATANGWTVDYIYEGTGGSGFVETIPTEGYCLTVEDEDAVYYYNDAANWVKFGNIIDHANLSNVLADQHHAQVHTFPSHSDTPANYSGAGDKFVKVNTGAGALEFSDNLIYDGDMKIKLGDNAGVNKLLVKDSDGTDVFSVDSDGLVSIIDPGTAEFASLSRTGTTFTIDGGAGCDKIMINNSGAPVMSIDFGFPPPENTITVYGDVLPFNSLSYDFGSLTELFNRSFFDSMITRCINMYENTFTYNGQIDRSATVLLINAGTLADLDIQSGDSAGVARHIHMDIPISAGGAAAAAIDMQMQLDGVLEAGLLAETDGAGSYREPVFKIPAYSADYGVAWASPPNPTPASLVDGGEFIAHNTNDNTYRIFTYVNGAWRSVEVS